MPGYLPLFLHIQRANGWVIAKIIASFGKAEHLNGCIATYQVLKK
jgi:hypothetical protein